MSNDDERYEDEYDEQPPPRDDANEVPASVTFMEIMRQAAAAKSAPDSQPEREQRDPHQQASPAAAPPPVTPPPKQQSHPTAPVALTAPVDVQTEEPDIAKQGRRAQAMEAQRVRRVQRRKARRRRRTFGVFGGLFRTILIVAIVAALIATILAWTQQLLPDEVTEGLSVAQATATSQQVALAAPTGLPTPNWLRRIGVVSGHRGPEDDPGAVCPDGLTETEINFNIAQLIVRNLRGRGYSVDLLDEFDPRLNDYQAAVLLSIHANTCQDFGEFVSGYLIAQASARPIDGPDNLLVDCIAQHYEQATGLQQREGVTRDMTEYHTFREIHPNTAAAIIELGFMLADRAILTGQPDAAARGLTDGILCFLEPGNNPPVNPPPDANTQSG